MPDYRDLLAAAQQNPEQADFHSLRMAYTQSDEYHPYAPDAEHLNALQQALNEGDFAAALTAAQGLLEDCYLDIEAHMAADYIYTNLEDYPRATYHRTFARGILNAIMGTGDGRSPETALIVIDIREEYTLCRILNMRPSGQRLIHHEGHWLDVLTVQHPESGARLDLHFNVDLPKNWLHHRLSGEETD